MDITPKINENSTIYRLLNGSINATNDYQIIREEEMLYDVPISIIVLLSLFYGTISILAVVGNSLVIWIVGTTRQMQTVTNFFIANLALADITIGMFTIPFQFQAALLQRWNLPEIMCPFCPFVQYVSVNVSVFTLTAIAVDRHRAILNPLRARPSKFVSKAVIICIWALAIALASPIAYALRVRQLEELYESQDLVQRKPFCQNVNLSEQQMLIYRYTLVFVQYIIPVCVISFVYIQMAVRLWGSKTPGNAQNARDLNLLKNKKRVIKMLVVVVISFVLCWLPLQTYNILQVTYPTINEYRYINIIWFCCDWLAMSNSCYNPFIYGIYNEKFKREFKKRCLCCKLGFHETLPDYGDKTCTSMHTRASSIRSNCANSSMRVKFPINIYHNSTYTPAGLTTAPSPLHVSSNGHNRVRNGLRYNNAGIATTELNCNSARHKNHHNARWQCNDDNDDDEYRELNGSTECAERYSMVYHKVGGASTKGPPGDNRQIYQQFRTSLVDNNNKCLCKYDDDEHYDRL
ncbi:RYamide receptor-like [Culicoides brevitarsis]|uniref:RYamide receptor-like n=1 Tax=Culicoides brevitarsis TaxID=469753 RepID=UPI00307BDEBC